MISGTINGTTYNSLIISKIEWSAKQIAEQIEGEYCSEVTASLYVRRTNSGYTTQGYGKFYIKIGDQTVYGSYDHWIIRNSWVKLVNVTVTVPHDSDGTKSVKISAGGSMPETSLKSVTCSKTVTLEPFNVKGTYIDEIVTDEDYIDRPFTIKYTARSEEYYNRLIISSGSTIIRAEEHGRLSGSGSHEVKFTPGELEACYKTNTSGTSTTVSFSFECYSDDAYTVKESTNSRELSMNFTLSEIAPVITGCFPVNENIPDDFSETFNKTYIQGISKLEAAAEGQYGAYITATKFTVNGKEHSASAVINTYGKIPVAVTVTDSRGVTAEKVVDIEVLQYVQPTVSLKKCERKTTEEGEPTQLYIEASITYSSLNGNNKCKLSLYYKEEGGTESKEYVLSNYDSGSEYKGVVSEINLDPTKAYTIRLVATDSLNSSKEAGGQIPKDTPTFVRGEGGNKASFGGFPEDDNMLDVYWNMRVRGELFLGENKTRVDDYIVEHGTSEDGIWIYRKWSSGIIECWGSVTQNASATSEWGDHYVTPYVQQTYPVTFDSRPYEQVTLHPGVTGVLMQTGQNSTTQTAKYCCAKTGSFSGTATFVYDFYLAGRDLNIG